MMKTTDKYTDKDWEELAARFSDERETGSSDNENFSIGDNLNTEKHWRRIGMTNSKGEVDTDNAWNKLHNRLENDGLLTKTIYIGEMNRRRLLLRIAAAIIIFAGLGTAALYIGTTGMLSGNRIIAADNEQRNIEVTLPDGSRVWLNRNSQISYKPGLGRETRKVKLTGEAFFDIAHDASRPFIIYAGNAQVKDIGTSFNVITSNRKKEVEVFVKSGKVMLSDQAGERELILEPGYIGTMGQSGSSKSLNENRNYLSWNTDLLSYNAEPLKNVFPDLKRVYNINIIADDPEILNETLSATYDKLPQDTIIRIICTTFNFRYQKEGNNYHLTRK
jgi:transmembrane sensor